VSDTRSVFLYTCKMSDTEQSEVPDLTGAEPEGGGPPPGKPKRRKKPFSWRRVGSNGLILAFAAVVALFLWSFVDRLFLEPPVEPETMKGGKQHTIQLDVLNGSGTAKLSQRFTDYLRSRGFDVVEMGNYKDSRVERTRVIDRAGNLAAAQQVAEALGVPKDRVTQEVDRTLYLDVSVVIGKDYRSLKPFKD
jgi:hypothetical protein